ncbi:MAG: hypothetical protein U1F17_06225 [Burkholderiaceae bacterium]
MIHGESYKPIVAEAAKKSADKVFNRICVTHLLMDESRENRVAGAAGFNVRTGNFHVFKAKTVICGAGGASNIFKPRSVGEGAGRTLVRTVVVGVGLRPADQRGRQDDADGKPHVLARFKDGYSPVGAYFLHLEDVHAERPGRGVRIQVVAEPAEDGRQGIPGPSRLRT